MLGVYAGAMSKPTAEPDRAYAEGRQAFHNTMGTHGFTYRRIVTGRLQNPYPRGSVLALAWQRGYDQDASRVWLQVG
jgi:hypothetical protein